MTATCLGDLHEKSSRPSVGVGDVAHQRTMMRPIKGISFQVGKSRNLHVANDECWGKYLADQFELIRRSVSLPTKYSNKLQHNHQGIIPREKYFHSSPPYSYSNDTYEQRVNCKGIILNTSKCCKLYWDCKNQIVWKSHHVLYNHPLSPLIHTACILLCILPLRNRQLHEYFKNSARKKSAAIWRRCLVKHKFF